MSNGAKKNLVVGNWKMQASLKEGRELARTLEGEITGEEGEIVVCPPFTQLAIVKANIHKIHLGAQDLFWETEGAYTGEISGKMLQEIGCEYVIVGHSERRKYLGETDAMINKKMLAALGSGLVPILCVGESLEQREKDQTLEIVEKQLLFSFAGVNAPNNFVIAYEPMWAIGTGQTVEPKDAEMVARYLRQLISKRYNESAASQGKMLYGGSVDGQNVIHFARQENIDGVLVGGASVDAAEFIKIVKAVNVS